MKKYNLVNWLGMLLMLFSGAFAFVMWCVFGIKNSNLNVVFVLLAVAMLNFGYYLSEKKYV